MTVTILPVVGIPEVQAGDDLAALITATIALEDGDIVVVASKVVSKAEGRRVTAWPAAGPRAQELAATTGFEPGHVALILEETREVLRAAPRVLVVETVQGFVCANAGVDRSNTGGADDALLLPLDPDATAQRLRAALEEATGKRLAVLLSDTFGRPFRNGLVNVALGVSGIDPVRDYRGETDPDGYRLQGTELAIADELCSAAELVMNKLDRVPVAIVRGYPFTAAAGSVAPLLRDRAVDYFR